MKPESQAAVDAVNQMPDPQERVAFAIGVLLASPPELIELEATELPDQVASTLAALILAPQVRRQFEPQPDPEVVN